MATDDQSNSTHELPTDDQSNSTHELPTDDQSNSTHELPYLVYHTPGEDGDVFFDIERQTWGKKSIPWFQYSMQLDTNSGWLLQFSFETRHLSLLHQSTGEDIPLPNLPDCPDEAQVLKKFVCRLCSSPPDCYVIAIHKIEKIYYLYRPGQTDHWVKYKFFVPKLPADDTGVQRVYGASVCGGEIYIIIDAIYSVVITHDNCTPKARCNKTYGPWGISDLSFPSPNSYLIHHILESDGEIYNVLVHLFDSEYVSRPRTVTVMRLNLSSLIWEIVTSIKDKAFLLGKYYSLSVPAANGFQRDMVYFGHRGNMYAFNMPSQSLTAHFNCQKRTRSAASIPPSWLLLGKYQYQYEEVDSNDNMEICCRTVPQSSINDEFDHPISISTYQPARNLLAKKGGIVTWCPKTPWLLLRHGHGSTMRFFDPCSSSAYALDIPELLNKPLHHSRDGWVLASGWGHSWFFFNPFTKQKIELPLKLPTYNNTLAISSLSPASTECLVFTINRYIKGEANINLFCLANNTLSSPLVDTSSLPLDLSYSSPVYHNGLFYCLGINGNLGVYDPIENSWAVKDRPQIAFDVSLVSTCFLIESDSKLYSVFMDEYDNPIGVYLLDSDEEEWIEVKDLMEKTIFLGKEASFIVPAPEKRMGNKIYLPVFHGKTNHELRAHEIGVQKCLDVKSFTTREYFSMWIEPKGVIFRLDQATGRVNHPTIRLHD